MLKLGCLVVLVFCLLAFGPFLLCVLAAVLDPNVGRRRR